MCHWFSRTVVILLLIPVLISLANNANANSDLSRKIALVIGNSTYSSSPLKNPVNDATDISRKLESLGFDVIMRTDLKTRQIGGTLREFRSKLVPGATALVFYAGHGLQIKGENYFPAVDAEINSEEDVPNQSLSMKQLMDVLDESKTRLNLVFLDACRNNPYARGFRSADRGLARVNAPSGTLISYATKPGSVAADGAGRNGLYTSILLAQMETNQQIEQALKRVVTEVKVASKGKQEPWMEGSIEGDFCFRGCSGGIEKPPVPGPGVQFDPESEAWGVVKDSADAGVVREFLKEYPDGKYRQPARLKLKDLESRIVVAKVQKQESLVSLADDIYAGGIQAFRSGDLKKARDLFGNYLEKGPHALEKCKKDIWFSQLLDVNGYPANGEKAPNAAYYLGETYFAEKDFDRAILIFQDVLTCYEKSSIAPAAMLKQAMAFQNIKDPRSANYVLKKIISDYPNTDEAMKAKSLLKR